MPLTAQQQDNDATLSHDQTWSSVKQQLLAYYGQAVFDNWFAQLVYKDFFAGKFIVAASTRFIRDWISSNYKDKILEFLKATDPSVIALDVVVDETIQSNPTVNDNNTSQNTTSFSEEVEDEEEKEFLGSRLEPRYLFENFVVGPPNELAHAAALRVADSDKVLFNPLFLYGGVGLGKTHLMHALAWHIKKTHPNRRVVYLSAEKFMYMFIRALRFKDTVAFKEKFRSVDVLMIDDFQFISGKEATQEEFFHTFNALVDQNHQVIISADKSPSDLEGLEDRMRSRLGWGLVADIHPTTYELRLGILQSKVEQLQTTISSKVLEFLAHKITSNIRELEGALNRIIAHSTLVGREITLENTQEMLRDVLRANDKRVTIDEIQRKVAEHYNIRISDMHSSRRQRNIARPRQIAMYLSKNLTSSSLPDVGRKFGGRDHTTVMHAVKKVEELKESDQSLAEDLDLLKRMLQN